MDDLKLIAFDSEDLAVLSAHLQDAVVRVDEMMYLPREKRFVALASRFDWAAAMGAGAEMRKSLRRRRAALRFERVEAAKVQGIDLRAGKGVLSLLAIQFAPAGQDDPAGVIVLTFSGGAAIRLEVECIEAELKDLGAAWRARGLPQHPERAD